MNTNQPTARRASRISRTAAWSAIALGWFATCQHVSAAETRSDEPDAFAAGASAVSTSDLRFKSGGQSLLWQWRNREATLTLQAPVPTPKATPKSGFALWAYQERPSRGRMVVEALYQNKTVGKGWFWMDYSGWRILGAGFQQIGVAKGQAVDSIRLTPPSATGTLWLDMCRIGQDHTAQHSLETPWAGSPDGLNLTDNRVWSANDPARNRPWLPKREDRPTASEQADITRLEQLFLSRRTGPGKGLATKQLEEVRMAVASCRIKRGNGTVTGRPVDSGTALKPDDAIPLGDYLKTLEAVKNAYYLTANPAEAGELKEMFLTLTAHLIDQGWAAGSRLQGFDNYPFGQYACFYAMKPELAEAGLIRPVAQALFDGFCGQGPLVCLAEHPHSSMDGLGFWNRELYACALMFGTPGEQLQHLEIAKRFLDLAILDPTTVAPDGCTYHHGGFHYAYASYNMPRLLSVLEKVAPTGFRISAEAHERLRVFVRSLAFTSSAGEQSYNLGMRAGTPMTTGGVEAVARMLATMGTPDGRSAVDPEMASISLRLLAETSPNGVHPNFSKHPWKGWLDAGIRPAPAPSGFLPLNGGTIAIHRREGWLANIAGMTPHYRCLEIYGWTQSNNYARYARNGSLAITSQGQPPNAGASGWAFDGWNWCHFPGTTAVRASRETDIFDGYAMYRNTRPNEGGTALGQDGVWCLDHSGTGVSFRKTYFCFGNRITSVTTGIRANAPLTADPRVTTLFQNAMNPEAEAVLLDGEPLPGFPTERTLTFETGHWILDNKQTGYLIPAGNDPLRISAKEQTWRHMTAKYLVDTKDNPIVGDKGYQKVRSTVKDITTLEKYYHPSKGIFALAWFDHGARPDPAACIYTAVVKTTPSQMRDLALECPVEFITQTGEAHILRDKASDTFAYAIYQPGGELPSKTPLLACDQPCTIMLRRNPDGGLAMSAAYTLAGNTVPADKPVEIRIQVRGEWHLAGKSAAVAATSGQGATQVVIRPTNNLPVAWQLGR